MKKSDLIGALVLVVPAALAAFSQGCKGGADKAPPIGIAKVGEDLITLDEFRRALDKAQQEYGALPRENPETFEKLKEKILNNIVYERLFTQIARDQGVKVGNEELDRRVESIRASFPPGSFDKMLLEQGLDFRKWREELRKKLLVEKVVEMNVVSKIEIPDEQLRAWYNANKAKFHEPERVQAAQIVMKTRTEIWKVLERLHQGEPFDKLAKELSMGPEAEQGGDLGVFARGQMPPEFDVAFKLKEGELSDVVESAYGYHIFKTLRRFKARQRPYEEVRDEILRALRREKEEPVYSAWLQQELEKRKIYKNLALLRELQ